MTVFLSVYRLFQDKLKQTPCSVVTNAWTVDYDVNLPTIHREQKKKKKVTCMIKYEVSNFLRYKLTASPDSNLETVCINERAQRVRSPNGNALVKVIQLHYMLRHHCVHQCE